MGGGAGYTPQGYWSDLHLVQRGTLAAVGWPALGEGFNRETYRLRLAAARQAVSRGGYTGGSLLEAAVGVGAYAPLWADLNVSRWTGLDISPEAIDDLAARWPEHRFLTEDLASRDFGGGLGSEQFALVTAIDVLFHLTDDDAFTTALENLAARVEPGGLLVLTDVFVDAPSEGASHVRHRPLGQHARPLAGHGLELVHREPVFAILDEADPGVPPSWKGRLLRMAWRVLSGLLRVTPGRLRDRVGTVLVRAVAPLDAALRRAGVASGANLELAVFRRAS
jgi:SAM-dependent methyltransferase